MPNSDRKKSVDSSASRTSRSNKSVQSDKSMKSDGKSDGSSASNGSDNNRSSATLSSQRDAARKKRELERELARKQKDLFHLENEVRQEQTHRYNFSFHNLPSGGLEEGRRVNQRWKTERLEAELARLKDEVAYLSAELGVRR